MAAAVDPLPVMSVPFRVGADVRLKSHEPNPLDALLLSSKLEDFQREQNAAHARREKRTAVRNRSYVPRSAATQFAATAAPQPEPVRTKPRSMPLEVAGGSVSNGGRHKVNDYVAGRDNVVPAIPGRTSSKLDKQQKRDSMSPQTKQCTETQSPTMGSSHVPGSLSTSSEANVALESEAEQRGRSNEAKLRDRKSGNYVPGDAAKRRSLVEVLPGRTISVSANFNRPLSYPFHAMQDLEPRQASASVMMKHEPVILEEPENTVRRPKMVPSDRPNWTQQSQAGSTLRLPWQAKRSGVDGSTKQTAPNNHLIADAVKIIKQEEKLKRRRSVIGFFKKL